MKKKLSSSELADIGIRAVSSPSFGFAQTHYAKDVSAVLGHAELVEDDLRKAKEFIKALVLAHKATKSQDHYQTTGDARRFIGME